MANVLRLAGRNGYLLRITPSCRCALEVAFYYILSIIDVKEAVKCLFFTPTCGLLLHSRLLLWNLLKSRLSLMNFRQTCLQTYRHIGSHRVACNVYYFCWKERYDSIYFLKYWFLYGVYQQNRSRAFQSGSWEVSKCRLKIFGWNLELLCTLNAVETGSNMML